MLFEQPTMFSDSTRDAFAPHAKTRGLQFPAHEVNDVFLSQACPLFDLLKAGAILPRIADDVGYLLTR